MTPRARSWTSTSRSPPGACASVGVKRQPARASGQPASTSSRCRPSHSPWAISATPGSARIGGGAAPVASAMAAATKVAVCIVRLSGEWATSRGPRRGSGRAGERCGTARRAAASCAWRSPSGDRGLSA